MFCINCGSKLPDGVNFCPNCGTKVAQAMPSTVQTTASNIQTQSLVASDTQPLSDNGVKAKDKNIRQKLSDKAVDALNSKVSKQKSETIRISMEDMLSLIKRYYIDPASTDDEYKAIQKTVNGGAMGVTHLESKDGNYYMAVKIVMQLMGRVDILNPGDSNWIRITEYSTGKVYQYSSFTWGKFKKAVKAEIEEAQK